ncbi:WD40 repeat domain-containing serine/threonine protein kinase [Actinomadura litoris]|uniref:WD40 repeat domain-containing serine/threonine protein kinase n=1 Tax=Actinomadura litoris TaxID=2678616 RepID=UPI001FA76191|nr:WD40 repeat domain-containing serine/threonine protein kinase [Actinomadura litoris]
MTTPLVPGDPRELGDYWLARRLGAGGQGVVYEAYGADGARVAVKALHGVFAGERAGGPRDVLAREIDAVTRVSPFCTARVLAFDLDAEPPYVVSEYVPGPDLEHAVASGGPFGSGELERLAIGVATALVAIHRGGVVHRDLKPGNVLLGPDGPRVIDFGLARAEDMTRSATGAKGTPRYMSPEVFAGEPASAASDVWAWGAVVLFGALGRPPFAGENLMQLSHTVQHVEPELHVLDEPLRSVVAAALAKRPRDRPSAREVLLDLLGGSFDDGAMLSEGSRVAAAAVPGAAPPSLADVAEAAYRRLDPLAREAVPAVLLRMVLPGEGAADTLRRAAVDEFGDGAERAVEEFTRAGLLIREGDRVAIRGAALLRAWPRLRGWVDDERAGLAVHRSLADAARVWDRHGRRTGDLLQGSVLARAVQWAATGRRHLTLNAVERAFLDASAALGRRRVRSRGALTAVLAVLLVVAVGGAVVAVNQRAVLSRQRDRAIADRLAALAASLQRDDPRTSRRLALAAARVGDDDQTRKALINAMYQWEGDTFNPASNAQVVLTPDGRTATFDDRVQVTRWDLKTHQRVPMPPGAEPRSAAVFSPDGRHMAQLLSTGGDLSRRGVVQVYDAATGKPQGRPMGDPRQSFWNLRYSVSGNLLMMDNGPGGSGDPRTTAPEMALWDARSGRLAMSWKERPYAWAVSADDGLVAMVLPSGFQLWDVAARKRIPTPWLGEALASGSASQRIRQVGFGPAGARLALVVGSRVTVLDLNNLARAEPVASRSRVPWHERSARGVDEPVFSPDGRLLAVGFTLWNLDGSAEAPLMDRGLDDETPTDCRFSAAGDLLRCATSLNRVVTTNISGYADRISVGRDAGHGVLSPSGDLLASMGTDGVSITGNPAGWTSPISVPSLRSVWRGMVFSPDGGLVAIPDRNPDDGFGVWDARTLQKVAELDWPDGALGKGVAFSPDGRSLVGGLNAQVIDSRHPYKSWLQEWDARSGRRTRVIPLESSGSGELFYQSDGRTVTLKSAVVDMESEQVHKRFDFFSVVDVLAVSPDGSVALVILNPDNLYLWDLRGDRRRGTPLAAVPDVEDLPAAFSPDGRLVATSDARGGVHLYEVATGRPYGPALPGHAGGVDTLAFSRDGTVLYTYGGDRTIQATTLDPTRLTDRLCAQVGGLSKSEWNQYVPDLSYRPVCG